MEDVFLHPDLEFWTYPLLAAITSENSDVLDMFNGNPDDCCRLTPKFLHLGRSWERLPSEFWQTQAASEFAL